MNNTRLSVVLGCKILINVYQPLMTYYKKHKKDIVKLLFIDDVNSLIKELNLHHLQIVCNSFIFDVFRGVKDNINKIIKQYYNSFEDILFVALIHSLDRVKENL